VAGVEKNIGVAGQEPSETIHVWDMATGRELFTLQPADARATAMAFSPDSKQLLTGFDRGTFAIWDVR
jgi:WD40 repeat protein